MIAHPFEHVDVGSYVSPGEHKITNGLHKTQIQESQNPFIVDGKTEYKILIGKELECEEGALFLQRQLLLATGAKLEIITKVSDVFEEELPLIVIHVPAYFEKAGLVMPKENMGQTGYYMKTVGKTVFLAGKTEKGVHRGVLAFLRYTVGYDFISEDTIVYERDGKTLPSMEITEVSDFEFYLRYNCFSPEDLYALGYDKWEIFIPVDGSSWHNTLKYLPQQEFAQEHPKWYATNATQMKGYDGKIIQEICLTAHGDEREYASMIQTIADKVIAYANKFPTYPTITISLMDHHFFCQCEACKAETARYGGFQSALLVKVVNDVNRIVQKHFEEKAQKEHTTKRELDILIFAYREVEKPPVKKIDGEWLPICQDVVLDDHVGVFLAPINAKYARSFYHEDNAKTRDLIEGWRALANDKLYLWTYGCNFHLYNFPLNNYETMTETFRFCKANGAKFMFMQGNGTSKGAPHFTALRSYIAAKNCFDVNQDLKVLENRFFDYYFGQAQAPMRMFYEELKRYLLYLETVRPDMILGGIYDEYELEGLWDKDVLERWLTFIDQAYALMESEKDLAVRERVQKHILRESLFPRYALLRCFPKAYDGATLKNMQQSFKQDCETVSLTAHWEGRNIQTIFDEWGV